MYINFFEKYDRVKAYFTTRDGGVSDGCFSSLNMGYNTPDDKVPQNREILKKAIGIENSVEIIPNQVHKSDIAVIDKVDFLERRLFPGDYDGLVTKEKNVLLTTCHADCLAVYLYDYKNDVIGLAHAGWRGTLANILKKTRDKMIDELGAEPNSMVGAISPGIGKCCFEVGAEVYEEFREVYPYIDEFAVKKENRKYMMDLKGINLRQFKYCGMEEVEVSEYCTSCRKDMFFSYRKEEGKTGRMNAGIMLL